MPEETCGAVVLAAGEARRFGAPKLLMPFGSSTVLGSVVDALHGAGVAPVIVVAGANIDDIARCLVQSDVYIVRNPNLSDGMVSSVRIGVEALPESLDRFLIALGDQPRIRAEGVSEAIRGHIESGKGIAIPVYQGRRGHPVVFGSRYRDDILNLSGDQTLRDLIQVCSEDIVEIDCHSDAYVNDIDNREQYEHELLQWSAEQQSRNI